MRPAGFPLEQWESSRAFEQGHEAPIVFRGGGGDLPDPGRRGVSAPSWSREISGTSRNCWGHSATGGRSCSISNMRPTLIPAA